MEELRRDFVREESHAESPAAAESHVNLAVEENPVNHAAAESPREVDVAVDPVAAAAVAAADLAAAAVAADADAVEVPIAWAKRRDAVAADAAANADVKLFSIV